MREVQSYSGLHQCDIRNDTISNYILRYVDIARKIGDTQCAYVRCDTVP